MPSRSSKAHARRAKQDLYRQLVLEAAEGVFAAKGYDDAKMEEIAHESGLSLGTLYSVFDGKAAVFGAIHDAADEELLRLAVENVEGQNAPLDAVLAGVRGYVGYLLKHPQYLRMILREGPTWGAAMEGRERIHGRSFGKGLDMLSRAVGRCVEAGVFFEGDPAVMARMMVSLQQVQLAHWIETGMKRDPEAVIDDVLLQVRRSFCRAEEDRS